MVLCASLLIGCDKDNDEYDPETPPDVSASLKDIVNAKIGNTDVIVGTKTWNSITYGNGKYIAVGQNGSMAYSSDGKDWTYNQVGTNFWKKVIYGNNKFIAVGGYNDGGYIATSTDGVTWSITKDVTDAHIFDICYIEKVRDDSSKEPIFVIVCHWGVLRERGYILKSNDGVNWTSIITLGDSYGWNAICYGDNQFVAVGNKNGTSGSCGIAISLDDGSSWEILDNSNADTWNAVTYGKEKYVAVGNDGYITSSEDGTTWKNPIGFSINAITQWFNVAYLDDKFVAVGNNGNYTTSSDGLEWAAPERMKGNSGKTIAANINAVYALQ